jgi:DNA-binding MarR family transcriptional regulator
MSKYILEVHNLLRTIKKLPEPITLSQLKCFLHVALNEGMSIVELAEKMGYNQASATRDMDVWSEIGRLGRPGMGYLERRDHPTDRRIRRCHLSTKGRALMRKLFEEEATDDDPK